MESQKLPDSFHYWKYAIADYDGEIELFFPENQKHVSLLSGDDGGRDGRAQVFQCRKIRTFMNILNHKHIDLLKMDIKGPEFSIIPQLFEENISFDQLVLEFTPEIFSNGNEMVKDTIALLETHGYYVFNVSTDGRNISIIHV